VTTTLTGRVQRIGWQLQELAVDLDQAQSDDLAEACLEASGILVDALEQFHRYNGQQAETRARVYAELEAEL
jgi:hypothetical protein